MDKITIKQIRLLDDYMKIARILNQEEFATITTIFANASERALKEIEGKNERNHQ